MSHPKLSRPLLSAVILAAALLACSIVPQQAPQEGAPEPGTPVPEPSETMLEMLVYFPNLENYASNTLPFEEPVQRMVPAGDSLPQAVVEAYFAGPTAAEQGQGLALITNGFTGVDHIDVTNGIARVVLLGECSSGGATYTIAGPLRETLLQFPSISHVKIYDQFQETEQPEGDTDSIPFCLEP